MSYSHEIETWLSNEAVGTGATMKEVLDIFYDGSKKIQYEHTRREFYKLKYEQYHEKYEYPERRSND